jgi:hypothetical protein
MVETMPKKLRRLIPTTNFLEFGGLRFLTFGNDNRISGVKSRYNNDLHVREYLCLQAITNQKARSRDNHLSLLQYFIEGPRKEPKFIWLSDPKGQLGIPDNVALQLKKSWVPGK